LELSGAVHASHDGVNTDFGPENSGAARDYAGTDTQTSCVGDWLLTAYTTVDFDFTIVEYMAEAGGPGSITTGLSDLMGLGVVLGTPEYPQYNYESCGENVTDP
jgi:hypothetical protein